MTVFFSSRLRHTRCALATAVPTCALPFSPFDEDSPFRGLAVPQDVTISRQVLAEPSLDLAGKTWARLTDGTPLVTAERRGEGWLAIGGAAGRERGCQEG